MDKNLFAKSLSPCLTNKIPASMKFWISPEMMRKLTGFKLKYISLLSNLSNLY